jgi:rhodanese-related sulfurtransferase
VAPEIPQIDRDELWELIQADEPLVLVDALAPMSYAHSHLPGAINLIPERVDDEAARRIPDRDANVVVYCANESCESSVDVAEGLMALGYTHVRHYAGGKAEWTEAGLPVDGRARAVR